MLPYCHSFEHHYQLPSIQALYPSGKFDVIKRIPMSLLDSAFCQWLFEHTIEISELVVAWKPAQPLGYNKTPYGTVHSDGPNITKINFVLGGTGSQMIWFAEPEKTSDSKTAIQTHFRRADEQQPLTVVYQEPIRAALVNAEPFHFIENIQTDRFAIQCTLRDLSTKKNLAFAQAHTRLFGQHTCNTP